MKKSLEELLNETFVGKTLIDSWGMVFNKKITKCWVSSDEEGNARLTLHLDGEPEAFYRNFDVDQELNIVP